MILQTEATKVFRQASKLTYIESNVILLLDFAATRALLEEIMEKGRTTGYTNRKTFKQNLRGADIFIQNITFFCLSPGSTHGHIS